MKKKKLIIAAVLVLIAAVAAVLIFTRKNETESNPESVNVADIQIDASAGGISVVSLEKISGMYVEDGSDEVMSGIFAATFRNDSDSDLQYARLVLAAGKEDYVFELSTVPAGATVRAMEMNKKAFVSSKGEVTLKQENIAWFDEAPSMYSNLLKITQRNNAIIVENISGQTIAAPIYVYYKNYTDGVYIGGITYRAGTQESLAPGKSVALSAKHFDPDASRLMFVTYAH